MDDRHAQFLIAVDDVCVAAGLAGLEVRLRQRHGDMAEARGVPRPRSAAGSSKLSEDIDYVPTLTIGDRIVNLNDVIECTLYAPDRWP